MISKKRANRLKTLCNIDIPHGTLIVNNNNRLKMIQQDHNF